LSLPKPPTDDFYYLDAAMAKMLQPGSSPAPVNAAAVETAGQPSKPAEVKAVSSFASADFSQQTQSIIGRSASSSFSGDSDANRKVVVANSDQPPAPRPLMKPVSGGVLNGKALSLPAPIYPEFARRSRTGGLVEVEVWWMKTSRANAACTGNVAT